MAKREFLQLAHSLNIAKVGVAGRFMSEKLDGQRFFWDGGVSRGVPVEQVPWANIAKSNLVPLATGLWSRYGKVINAPDWWLDELPSYMLDGELWTGYREFQRTSSIVRSNVNPKDWTDVKAMVFDMPHPDVVLADGKIDNTNYKKVLTGCRDFYYRQGGLQPFAQDMQFASRYRWMTKHLPWNRVVQLHPQEQLPFSTDAAVQRIYEASEEVLNRGGEGLIIKSPNDLWVPERCHSMLKFKPWNDAEGTVVGYTWGRETDRGSKLLGLMGAMICKISAGEFKLSGFTDEERVLIDTRNGDRADATGQLFPGEIVQSHIHNPKFPRGSTVTYRYRELTDSGLPKEGRYWRQ